MKLSPILATNYTIKNKPNFKGWIQFNNAIVNSNNVESVQISRNTGKAFIITTSGGYLNTDTEFKTVANALTEASKSYSVITKCRANVLSNGSIRKHIRIDNEYIATQNYEPETMDETELDFDV